MPDGARRAERLISGALASLVWGGHAVDSTMSGHAVDLLWMCNLGGLLLALSLFAGSSRGVAVAACWLLLGVPLWALDLAAGGSTTPSSIVSHMGGLSFALWGVYRLGWPRWTTLPASGLLALLMLLSRLATPPSANVNLVFEVWAVWEGRIGHGVYLLFLGALATSVFAAIDALLCRVVRSP